MGVLEDLAKFKGILPGAHEAANNFWKSLGINLEGDQAKDLAGKLVSAAAGVAGSLSKGGRKGVELVDVSSGLTLGHISRARALRMLQRRRGVRARRGKGQVVVVSDGQVTKVQT